MSSHTYTVKFLCGAPEAVERIEANLLRDGGSLSSCGETLMHIRKALDAPRCCKKIGDKVAGLREQLEDEKKAKIAAEIRLEWRDESIEKLQKELAAAKFELETLKKQAYEHTAPIVDTQLAAMQDELTFKTKEAVSIAAQLAEAKSELDTSKKVQEQNAAAVQTKLAMVMQDLDCRDEQVKKLNEDLATTKSELEASKKAIEHDIPTLTDSELAAVKCELTAVQSELNALLKEKKNIGINNFRIIARKNGELAALKKDLKVKEKEGEEQQRTIVQVDTLKEELEASKKEVQEQKQALARLITSKDELEASKKDVMQLLTTTKNSLDVCEKEAQDNAAKLVAVQAELEERKKMTGPQKHLSNQLAAAKKELDATKEETQWHQQAAFSAQRTVDQAHQHLAQYQFAYDESHHTVTNLEAKISSLESTKNRASESLLTVQHDLAAARADTTVAAQDLAIAKKSATTLAAELTQAQSTITGLQSELEIVKIELDAYKASQKPAAAAAAKPTPAAAPPTSAAAKMAAWGNAQALVRADDQDVRRANIAKAEAMKDQPAGEWREAYRVTGPGKAKQSKLDAARAVLDGIEKDLAAKDAQITSLKEALADERTAGAERKRELADARSALESTQGALRDARSDLALALNSAPPAAGCRFCPDLERRLRHARATADAALMQLDNVHYQCMSTWALLHDVTWNVECKLSVRSGTPELTASASDGSESDGSVEFVGGDGEAVVWDRNIPPHLRRGGFAGRSLARHMPGLVRK